MLKKFFTLALMFATLIFVDNAEATIPSLSSGKYMRAYVLSTANDTPVYTSQSLNQRGTYSPFKAYNATIYANDEIYILGMNDSVALISYPTSSGRRQGYIRSSAITGNNYSQNAVTCRSAISNVYARPNGTRYPNSRIDSGDTVWTLARSGNYTQVAYPAGNVYKLAWITNSDYDNYVAQQSRQISSPTPPTTNHNPQGTVEQVNSPSPGVLHVRGKAYDLDNARGSIRLHVYVGGGAGSSAPSYEIRTNGSSNIFDDTRQVSRTGSQRIYIYALNDYGSGENKEIWNGVVNIKSAPSEDWDSKVGQQLADINSDNYKSKNPYYRYGYSRECTWYAWGRMREVPGKEISFGGSYPRANLWQSKTTNCSTCELQSRCVAVRMSGGRGNGHVAFVEYVDNNHVYYTDDNWDSKTNLKVQRKTISEFKNSYQYFIR